MHLARSVSLITRLFAGAPAAVIGIAALALGASSAQAIPVLSTASNIVVPITTAGIYINVVTGAANAAPGSAPGWDINPWGTGSPFLWSASTGGIVSTAGAPASLAVGSVVGPASTFVASGSASPFAANSTNYFGFSFIGEDAALHYGYGTMIVGATTLTRTVGSLWYESAANTAITISAVPEPTSMALMLAGITVGSLVLRRRKQD